MKLVGSKVVVLFSKAFELAKQIIGKVTSNVVSIGIFTLGTVSDNALFFLPTSITVKIAVVVSLVVSFLLGAHLKMIGTFGNVAAGALTFPLQKASDLDKSLDAYTGLS